MPRITSRQTQRANIPAETPEEYFRRVVYIPLLENVISDMKDLFSSDVMSLFNLNVFLPRKSYTDDDIKIVPEVAENYQGLLNNIPFPSAVSEYKLWIAKWQRKAGETHVTDISHCLLNTIEECDKEMHPSINILLRILATLPVSDASSERSFSTLRRLKNWFRASTGEERHFKYS